MHNKRIISFILFFAMLLGIVHPGMIQVHAEELNHSLNYNEQIYLNDEKNLDEDIKVENQPLVEEEIYEEETLNNIDTQESHEMKDISKDELSLKEEETLPLNNSKHIYLDDVEILDPNENVRVIIELKDKPLTEELTDRGIDLKDLSISKKERMVNSLEAQQNKTIEKISQEGLNLKVEEKFSVVLNGFSTDVKLGDIDKILEHEEVKDVHIVQEYEIPNDIVEDTKENGNPDIIDKNKVWDMGYKGQGELVSIIDSGIDVNHKDMKITDISKAKVQDDFKYNEKVPYGNNWVEYIDDIKDDMHGSSCHGMHVAGIVAANGEKHKGVAPEAQLMGHKVFANHNKPIAQTDGVIKALEDSIVKGADVVNMSLGTKCGFKTPDNPFNKAVQNAIDHGVCVVISAGNDYYSTKDRKPYLSNPDIATMGNPGTIEDAITVASYENPAITYYVMEYTTEDVEKEKIIIPKKGDKPDAVSGATKKKNKFDTNKTVIEEVYSEDEVTVIEEVYADDKEFNLLNEIYLDDEVTVEEKVYSNKELTVSNKVNDNKENMNIHKDESEKVDAQNGIIAYMNSNNEKDPTDFFKGKYLEIVDCGKGGSTDFPHDIDLEGKIALIENKSFSFELSSKNALDKNMAGVIFYNSPQFTELDVPALYQIKQIPVVLVSCEDGAILKEVIAKNGAVRFKGDTNAYVSKTKGEISKFSSWGPNSDLSFKPDVAAPGGKIWSTVNNDKYTNMSGTSMAAPMTAGSAALLDQYLKEKYPSLTGKEKVVEIKNRLIATAEPVMIPEHKEDLQYSPRKQGSGLINIEKAIQTKAIVTNEEGTGALALGSFGNTKEFTFKVVNKGDKELTFDLHASKVLTDGSVTEYSDILKNNQAYNTLEPTELKGASVIFDENNICVPAGDTVFIKATINVPSNKNNLFAEGFIYLDAKDEDQPNLSIPYMGFCGDWDRLRIIDEQMGEEDSYFGYTCLATEAYDDHGTPKKVILASYEDETKDGRICINNDYASFAPNGSMKMSNYNRLIPIISLMRNAEELEVNILDENHTKLMTKARNKYLRKSGYSPNTPFYMTSPEWIWNGQVYYKECGYMKMVPNGQYYIQFRAKAEGSNRWQTKELPVKVDTKGPKVKITSKAPVNGQKNYKLTWEAEDNLTDIERFEIRESSNLQKVYKAEGHVREFVLDSIKEKGSGTFIVKAYDYANNVGYCTLTYGDAEVGMTDDKEKMITINSPGVLLVSNSEDVYVEVKVLSPKDEYERVIGNIKNVSYKILNEDGATLVERYFDGKDREKVFFTETENIEGEGRFKFDVEVEDTNGKKYKRIREFFIDKTKPELVFDNVPENNTVIVDKDTKVYKLTGTISDNLTGFGVMINGEPVVNEEFEFVKIPARKFEYDVVLEQGTNIIQVQGSDTAKNGIYKTIKIVREGLANGPKIEILSSNQKAITDNPFIEIKGKLSKTDNKEITKLFIGDEEVAFKEDGSFTKKVNLVEGENTIAIKAIDELDKTSIKMLSAVYDHFSPTIEIMNPADGAVINSDKLLLKGKIYDDYTGYTLYVDGKELFGTRTNAPKDFEKNISLKSGENTIILKAVDEAGNEAVKNIKVRRVDGNLAINNISITSDKEIGFSRPAKISASAGCVVNWSVDIIDPNGNVVDTIEKRGIQLNADWMPEDMYQISGVYKAVFNVVNDKNEKAMKEQTFKVYNYPTKTKSVHVKDMQGNNKNRFSIDEPITIHATIHNIGPKEQNALLIVQVLDPKGNVVNISSANISEIADQKDVTLSSGFTLSKGSLKGQYTVETYVWNSWKDIQPLSEKANSVHFHVK